jgi:hypothetical protein
MLPLPALVNTVYDDLVIVLRNHDRAALMLRLDRASCDYEEVPRGDFHEFSFARGFYITIEGHVVGVFASPLGPIFFHDKARVPMADPAVSVTWLRGEREHRFALQYAGQDRFVIAYPPRTDWGYDVWSADEDSADFLLWLYTSTTEDRFIPWFTLDDGDIYVPGAVHIASDEDDFRGGLCRVKAVTLRTSAGAPCIFVEVEEDPGTVHNWSTHLAAMQSSLEDQFGRRRGHVIKR